MAIRKNSWIYIVVYDFQLRCIEQSYFEMIDRVISSQNLLHGMLIRRPSGTSLLLDTSRGKMVEACLYEPYMQRRARFFIKP